MTQLFPNPSVGNQPAATIGEREITVKTSASAPLLLLLIGLIAALPATVWAAGKSPPLPRPRPDVAAQPGPPDVAPGQETDQQRLARTGMSNTADGDSLMPPVADAAAKPTGDTTPQTVTLQAEITEKGAKIGDGLVWRVFDTRPDKNGQLAMVAKSEQAAPTLKLPPGDYVVHVAFGRAQASDTFTVGGKTSKQIILDAGGLRLNAAIAGDIPIPINLLRFDVSTAGASDADRALVAEKVSANDILTLNAGTYHIVSYFGDLNATVRADLRVEPGQLTDATLFHKAAQVSFKLVSETGGEAIADVDWTVKTAEGQTIFTNTGTFPTAVLEEGDYQVLAKRADKVYNRKFQIVPGKSQEIEVLTTVY